MEEEQTETKKEESQIYALRTTANREDQVVDFVVSNVLKKKLNVYSILRPHGMRGYVFVEAGDRGSAEEAFQGVPYAKSLLDKTVKYVEIEPMIEQSKAVVNIQKNDIVEIISGPFKREKGKIVRVDMQKEEIIVELLETAIPIPLTLKLDSVKVIRREKEEEED
ncbi:MAG: transcription elongation factor Spt5 [Nanoarchaeota archaeon]|nr:transcription elongation factor Spt5 [Nanoarchaeota archaeon]